MSDADGHHWFIDAWAVLDGYAFASFRRPDSLDTDVTLFVAPPYFEPEAVASLATALGATRGHFQEGFRGTDGGEVAFGTLGEVIEAIRRGYRAGGLDIDGTALPGVRTPPIEPDGGGAAIQPAELVTPEMRDLWPSVHAVLLDDSTSPARDKQLESLLARLVETSLPKLVPKFIGYAAVTQLAILAEPGPERSERARDACAWIDKVRGLGVHVNIDTDNSSVTVSLMGAPDGFVWTAPWLDKLPHELRVFLHPIMYRTSGALVSDFRVPFTVPIAPAFQAGTGKIRYPPIPTLGHLMAAASADRQYVRALDAMHQIVPLLMLGLVQLPAQALPYPGLPRLPGTAESREMCGRAAAWLVRALPSGILRNHPTESAIHGLVSDLLTRSNGEDEGTPAPLSPHPGPAPRSPGRRVRLPGAVVPPMILELRPSAQQTLLD
jgi:hypothetical protein